MLNKKLKKFTDSETGKRFVKFTANTVISRYKKIKLNNDIYFDRGNVCFNLSGVNSEAEVAIDFNDYKNKLSMEVIYTDTTKKEILFGIFKNSKWEVSVDESIEYEETEDVSNNRMLLTGEDPPKSYRRYSLEDGNSIFYDMSLNPSLKRLGDKTIKPIITFMANSISMMNLRWKDYSVVDKDPNGNARCVVATGESPSGDIYMAFDMSAGEDTKLLLRYPKTSYRYVYLNGAWRGY